MPAGQGSGCVQTSGLSKLLQKISLVVTSKVLQNIALNSFKFSKTTISRFDTCLKHTVGLQGRSQPSSWRGGARNFFYPKKGFLLCLFCASPKGGGGGRAQFYGKLSKKKFGGPGLNAHLHPFKKVRCP